MYLYEKQNNNINIYNLEPDSKNITKYRKLLMQGLIDNSIYSASTSPTTPNKILESKTEVNVKDLNTPTTPIVSFSTVTPYINRFHSFKLCYPDESILNNYYSGYYEGKRLVKVYKENVTVNDIDDIIGDMNFKGIGVEGFINNKPYIPSYKKKKQIIQYLLVTEKYSLTALSNNLKMNNIISIPEELYIIETLINGDLSKLDDIDDNILKLFYLYQKPIMTVSIDKIKDMINYGLISDNTSDIKNKIQDSEKILKKLI